MSDFIRQLNTQRFDYWIALIGMVFFFGGFFAMQLRLQQIPLRGRWLDAPYLCGAAFFLAGIAIIADFILELFGIYALSPIRTLVEDLLGYNLK